MVLHKFYELYIQSEIDPETIDYVIFSKDSE